MNFHDRQELRVWALEQAILWTARAKPKREGGYGGYTVQQLLGRADEFVQYVLTGDHPCE